MRGAGRVASAFALAAALAVSTAPEAPAALHAGFQIHILDAAGAAIVRTDSYAPLLPFNAQRADWAGRWWAKDLADIPGAKNPVVAVALQSVTPAGLRQSAAGIYLYDPARGFFAERQILQVGPPGSEIHHLTIFNVGPAVRLDVYEGLDPLAVLTVHQYTWNGATFVEGAPRNDVLPAPPESLPMPPAGDLLFGPLPGTPFDVTTSGSRPGASSLEFIGPAGPADADLVAEATPRGGMYASTVAVTLSSNSPGATLQYTLDGSDPGSTSPVYTPGRPLWIQPCDPVSGACAGSVVLSFKARQAGKTDSAVGRETYAIAQGKSADSDGDGLIDMWETTRCVTGCRIDNGAGGCVAAAGPDHCFDPLAADADTDCDRDGWSDFDEIRLGSDPACGSSRPAPGAEMRRARFSGSVALPDAALPAAGSPVEGVSAGGSDLLLHAADPNDDPVTDPMGSFFDLPTRGEADVILGLQDDAQPQVLLQRFVGYHVWSGLLPERMLGDADFTNAADWLARYSAALQYDVSVGGLAVDARSSAMMQAAEHELESLLSDSFFDLTGIAIADLDRPPTGNFPTVADGDIDLDGDMVLDRYDLTLGRRATGLTGQERESLLLATDPALLATTLLEAAEDPAGDTWDAWVAFAEDVYRAVPRVGPPESPGYYHGTTDDALTDVLDGVALDPDLAAEIDALPAPLKGGPPPSLLPNLPALAASANAAAHATAAFYGRVVARRERAVYEQGDTFATGPFYRAIVAALVNARAGDPAGLGGIAAGAEQAARAVAEARLLALGGRVSAVQNLRLGIRVLARALAEAVGGGSPDPSELAHLDARMRELVYRIDRAAPDPAALAALEARATDFQMPDMEAPAVSALPAATLFTTTVDVILTSDEPATIYYTLNGSDPSPGSAGTFSGVNEVASIPISSDTTVSFIGRDGFDNESGVSRITYRRDGDADMVADYLDNCPLIANGGQQDFDADAMGDACDPDDDNDTFLDGTDCRPLDPTLWSSPAGLEVTIDLDASGPVWSSLAASCGPATIYDVARGTLSDLQAGHPPGDEFLGAVCLVDGGAPLSFADPAVPAPADGFYYLVRAENPCGTGPWGYGASGAERMVSACP